ncbi:MAG: LysR substrate-binding domain-containing protein [Gammaproteobacteria bacterium]
MATSGETTGGADKSEREGWRIDAQLLSDLWVFRAAARTGSMSAAALELSVTAGAVSQRVLRLEARLNTKLFERKKSRLTLTGPGGSLLDAMNGVSLLLGNTLARLERPSGNSVVISCGQSLATQWLMPHLTDFYRDFPGIELIVRSETAKASAAWMAEEGVDVVIQYGHERPGDLVELASVQELIFPVCSPDFGARLRALSGQERTAVAMHDTDVWREGELPRAEWQEWLAGAGTACTFFVSGERYFNQAQLAYQAATYGQGIAIGRSVSVNALLAQGKLVPALEAPLVPSAHYRVLARIEQPPDSPAGRFAAWAARTMALTQHETVELARGRA